MISELFNTAGGIPLRKRLQQKGHKASRLQVKSLGVFSPNVHEELSQRCFVAIKTLNNIGGLVVGSIPTQLAGGAGSSPACLLRFVAAAQRHETLKITATHLSRTNMSWVLKSLRCNILLAVRQRLEQFNKSGHKRMESNCTYRRGSSR